MRKTGWIAIVLLSASSILLPSVTQSTFCAEQPAKLGISNGKSQLPDFNS